MGIILLWDC